MTLGDGRIRALDGIRALAIGGVFGIHANGALPGGHLGVSVFFVLSGYLITTLLLAEYRRKGTVDFSRFYLRRATRLLPALAIVLVVYAVFLLVIGTPTGTVLVGVLASALYSGNLVHAYVPSMEFFGFTWTWTLSLEEQFYFLWPGLLILAARRRGLRDIAVVAASLVFVSVGLRVVLPLGTPEQSSRIYAGVDTRMSGLLLGALLSLILTIRPTSLPRRRASSLAAGALVTILAGYLFGRLGERPVYAWWILIVEIASIVLILAVLAGPDGFLARVLSWGPLVHIGQVSYGLYLWNIPAYRAVQAFFPAGTPVWKTGVLWLLLTAALTEASFHWLEQPLLRRQRGRLRPETVQEKEPVLVGS